MKKIMFLIGIVMTVIGCNLIPPEPGPVSDPYPPGEPWTLDIVKFKKLEYKNHVLARWFNGRYVADSVEIEHIYGSLKNKSYILTNTTSLYYFYNVLYNGINYETYYSFIDAVQKEKWIELEDGYYLCYWPWQRLLCCHFDRNAGAGYYAMYNWTYKKDDINNLLIMKDEWQSIELSTYYRKDTVTFEDSIRYYPTGYVYLTTDSDKILDSNPFSEHYVITANCLYNYTKHKRDKLEEIFLSYSSSYVNGGILLDIKKLLHIDYNYPRCPQTYDSLSNIVSLLLKEVIEDGKLQELVDYDFEYNKRGNFWWGAYEQYLNQNLYR